MSAAGAPAPQPAEQPADLPPKRHAMPAGGYVQLPHTFIHRVFGACEGVEFGVLMLICDETIGWKGRTHTQMTAAEMARVLNRDRHVIYPALKGLKAKGLIGSISAEDVPPEKASELVAKGDLDKWGRVDCEKGAIYWPKLEAFAGAQPVERAKPELVEMAEADDDTSPSSEELELLRVDDLARRYGWTAPPGVCEVVVAHDSVHAAVCRCGGCNQVSVARLLSQDELRGLTDISSRGEQGAKPPPDVQPTAHLDTDAVTSMQRYLARWNQVTGKPVFAPTRAQAQKVVAELGKASMEEYMAICDSRTSVLQKARSYGIYVKLAQDAAQAAAEVAALPAAYVENRVLQEDDVDREAERLAQDAAASVVAMDAALEGERCPLCNHAGVKVDGADTDTTRCCSSVCYVAFPHGEDWRAKARRMGWRS